MLSIDEDRVRAVLSLGGVPRDDLDDGVQAVRIKFLESDAVDNPRRVRTPTAWACVVASNVAVDWHRRRGRDERLRNSLELQATRTDVSDPMRAVEQALSLDEALRGLSPIHAQVIVLRHVEDLTVREISRALDVPLGTVKSRLHHAEAAMKARLHGDRDGGVEDAQA